MRTNYLFSCDMEDTEDLTPLYERANTAIWKHCSKSGVYRAIRQKYIRHLEDESLPDEIRFPVPNEAVHILGNATIDLKRDGTFVYARNYPKISISFRSDSQWHEAYLCLTRADGIMPRLLATLDNTHYKEGITTVAAKGWKSLIWGPTSTWDPSKLHAHFAVELIVDIPRAHRQLEQCFLSMEPRHWLMQLEIYDHENCNRQWVLEDAEHQRQQQK